jgi:hypothetical protein
MLKVTIAKSEMQPVSYRFDIAGIDKTLHHILYGTGALMISKICVVFRGISGSSQIFGNVQFRKTGSQLHRNAQFVFWKFTIFFL